MYIIYILMRLLYIYLQILLLLLLFNYIFFSNRWIHDFNMNIFIPIIILYGYLLDILI